MFIYGLQDPVTKQVRYIGATKNSLKTRLQGHLGNNDGTHRYHWIKSLLSKGIRPEIFLIEKVKRDDWEESERFWISYFKYIGANLVNGTDGGGGIPFPSQDIRNRIGIANSTKLKGRTYKDIYGEDAGNQALKRGLSRKGKTLEEIYGIEEAVKVRARLSETAVKLVGRKASKETRDKLSKARQGFKLSQESIDKMKITKATKPGATRKGMRHTEETKSRMRHPHIRRKNA